MQCLFCKGHSDHSISIEHIVPESLGNEDHILPQGWVCDSCNNYFARKVEKPFLENHYAVESRFRSMVSNKKGRYPVLRGMHLQSLSKIELSYKDDDPRKGIEVDFSERSRSRLLDMKLGEKGTFIIPHVPEPCNDTTTARFVAKIGLEVLAFRLKDVPGANEELVGKPELDKIRVYARRGQPQIVWPISLRRIYPENFLFVDGSAPPYEVLHEFDILCAPGSAYYAVIAIFGWEYVINLGGPELDGYQEWLKKNNGRSPLYSGKNAN